MPLQLQNIESELSYAYLHAIASKAGLNCRVENRHADNYGVDATIDFFDTIPQTYRTDITLRIQLKATTSALSQTAAHFSYFFKGVPQFDRMRTNAGEPHRILVVLMLPDDPTAWLNISASELILKNAAYWVCLYGALGSTNQTGQTIYLPKANLLTPDSLRSICHSIGQNNIPTYQLP